MRYLIKAVVTALAVYLVLYGAFTGVNYVFNTSEVVQEQIDLQTSFYNPVTQEYTFNLTGPITTETDVKISRIIIGMLPDQKLIINIDSPGGDMMASIHITNLISKNDNIIVKVDTMAASGAAIITVGAKHRIVNDGAVIMFHLPYVQTDGHFYARNYETNKYMVDYLNIIANFETKIGKERFTFFALGGDLAIMGKEFNEIFGAVASNDNVMGPRYVQN